MKATDIFNKAYERTAWRDYLGTSFGTQLYQEPSQVAVTSKIAKQVWDLGYIQLNDDGIERIIQVFEVELSEGITLERNRVGLRNLLRSEWKDIDGAFIVYHQADNPKWRFTYVSELSGFDAEGNRQEIKTEPKRYTYVLGEGESTKTAQQRFSRLEEKGANASLQDVLEAFSVEKLSKEFFDGYKEHYEKFYKHIESTGTHKRHFKDPKGKDIRDFCKKLLGRIVFLYFVQKKGWLGVPLGKSWGDGDKNFLQTLFEEQKDQKYFYSLILAPLFFESLNQKRHKDIFKLNDQDYLIPYLNGGLFEEEDKKQREIDFPADYFKELFGFFNQYNFTIYEDEPKDQTLAIDPEMLGHIFENLLEDNKDKGAFYTPKEIVQYMCQESLIQYLAPKLTNSNRPALEKLIKKQEIDPSLPKNQIPQIQEALDSVKICDPAIGSGAFPMGLLHEIYTAKQCLHDESQGKWNPSQIKLDIIQNSIYGVDIEKGAVDISRLRFWLSLVVDESNPKPLPNLDYKIVAGNSLLSKLDDQVLEIEWEVKDRVPSELDERLQKQLKILVEKQKQFFAAHGDKSKLNAEIQKCKIAIFSTQAEIHKQAFLEKNKTQPSFAAMESIKTEKERKQAADKHEAVIKLDNLIEKLKKLDPSKPFNYFDWKLNFPEICNEQINPNSGFDIVIGNPPYVSLEKIGDIKDDYKRIYDQVAEGRSDLYCLFYELGLKIAKENLGLVCLITSNKWMRAGYGQKLRGFFAQRKPLQLIDFGGFKVFESATVDTNILLIQNQISAENSLQACHFQNDYHKGEEIGEYFAQNKIQLNSLSSDTWIIGSQAELDLKKKIDKVGTPLKYWKVKINYGIKTGFNEAFIIDTAKRNELVAADENSAEIIKPILRGRDIKRYGHERAGLWVIIVKFGDYKTLPLIYPAIYQHFLQYEEKLKNRGQCKYSRAEKNLSHKDYVGQHHWLELDNNPKTEYIEMFEKEKVVWNRIAKEKAFSLVERGIYITDSMHFFTGKNLRFISAILNSKLMGWSLNLTIGDSVGGNAGNASNVKDIPIPQITPQNQNSAKKIKSLVDQILAAKKNNPSADSRSLEEEIDKLVFDLYDLTESERALVLNS